jgi:hypothetical protein
VFISDYERKMEPPGARGDVKPDWPNAISQP